MIEEWRPTHHPDYDVSNLGRVRSWTNRGKRANIGRQPTPRILKQGSCRGHLRVNFGANKGYYVHRLVATAFLGPCPEGKECMHADDNRGNNRLDNLSWGTRTQNIADAVLRGRVPKGVGHYAAKLTVAQVKEIRNFRATRVEDIACKFGIAMSTVYGIRQRRSWKHV